MKKILEALTGIKYSEKWPNQVSLVKYDRMDEPPSYLIRLVFTVFLKAMLPEGGDKSDWELPIEYKGRIWLLWDWKRYAWNLEGPPNHTKEAEELIKKIKAAAAIMDRDLALTAKKKYESGEFSLQNQYHKLRGLYDFFRENSEKSSVKKQKVSHGNTGAKGDIDTAIHSLSSELNLQYQKLRRIEANTIAAVVFYLAMIEVIMDACFSLSDRKDLTYADFKGMNWSERLKWLIPVGSSNDLNRLFSDIVFIRTEYRNLTVHSSPEFFFHIPYFGLVPSTYKKHFLPHAKQHPSIGEEQAKKIFEIFGRFEAMLRKRDETKFGMIYAESGLPIHIDNKTVSKLKRKMNSLDEFKSELEHICSLQDAFDNMDI